MHRAAQHFQLRVKNCLSTMIRNDPLDFNGLFPNRVCAQFSSFGQLRVLFSSSNSTDDVQIPLLRRFV